MSVIDGDDDPGSSTAVDSVEEYAALLGPGDEAYVFVYGSLMWNPPAVVKTHRATLHGFVRAFNVYSRNYRGTADKPGLCLGLEERRGGVCDGVALELGLRDSDVALSALRAVDDQEMIAAHNTLPVYVRRVVTLSLNHGLSDRVKVVALAYVANAVEGASVPPSVPLVERARIINRSSGARGPNRVYLENTSEQLQELGIQDPAVDEMSRLVRAEREVDSPVRSSEVEVETGGELLGAGIQADLSEVARGQVNLRSLLFLIDLQCDSSQKVRLRVPANAIPHEVETIVVVLRGFGGPVDGISFSPWESSRVDVNFAINNLCGSNVADVSPLDDGQGSRVELPSLTREGPGCLEFTTLG